MNWILIAITSGMLMTGNFENEEACLGRKAILEKNKITNIRCIDMSMGYTVTSSSNNTSSTNKNAGVRMCNGPNGECY